MENSKWNTGASVPVNALTPEELKEAIHEWAEGCEELEKLLWLCHQKGLETAGCHVGKNGNYLQFYVNPNSNNLLKRVLLVAESYGFAEIFMMFGGNPYSGPNWHRTTLSIDCLIPENVGEFYTRIGQVLESEAEEILPHSFGLMTEFAEFFEDKLADLNFRMRVRNHCEYEFYIEKFNGEYNWTYFDELFGSLGMTKKQREDAPFVCWSVKSSSEKEFCDALKVILTGIRTKWSLKVPTEILDPKDFNFNALLMQKKFGITPEGVKKMNDWINANNPSPDRRDVNY